MKLGEIYNEVLNEGLVYHGASTTGVEDDEYEIGPLRELDEPDDVRFNDGKFNKHGANTLYLNDNPIVDFGVGAVGNLNVSGVEVDNALYLQGGYSASKEHAGYGSLGIKYIFKKLPKINNIIVQCYDNAKTFWSKMGGKVITSKDIANSGHLLYTMVINRASLS